eukprot:TRINITY_DN4154_c0_g1_i1.p1 TRINITY_DN4154_c0_g1~~TRINITY_DN4154_c0_g1_i1.p1  ORF type:complete len:271 (-),score=55.02 TRINITY_DN4154_c0_g1_i1:7-819(-)
MERDFTIISPLGNGVFGKVQLVRNAEGQQFALKTMNKLGKGFKPSHAEHEVRSGILTKSSKGICQLIDHWENEREVHILLEYIEGMDLISFMANRKFAPIKEEQAQCFMKQIVSSLLECHAKGIAHRDVKLDNIMIQPNGDLKIIDFGLSKTLEAHYCQDEVGSIEYAAPEILRKCAYDGYKADVYSLGVVLFALLIGEFPFSVTKIRAHKEGRIPLTLTFPFHKKVSNLAQNLLVKLLRSDPRERIAMDEVLNHPWFPLQRERAQSSES